MATEVLLPQWGMGMTEGTVVEWFRGEGESVAGGEPLVEIETAKAVQPLDAPVTGVLTRIVAGPGQVVQVGGVLATIDEAPDPA